MRVVTFRGEESVSALATKVYGKLTVKDRKAAETALLKANPQLERLDALEPGTVLRVPETGGLAARAGTELEDPVGAVGANLLQQLDDCLQALTERHETYQTSLKEQATLLKDRDLRKAISDSKPLQERVREIAEQLGGRSKAAEASRKRLEAAVENLKADLTRR